MRTGIRASLALSALAIPLACAPTPPRPARAHACVTLTVWQAGAPTTHGPYCQSALDSEPHLCPEPSVRELGYGAKAVACVPDPPVRRQPQ